MSNKASTDINYIIQMSLKGDKKYQEILLNKLKPLIYRNIYKYWNYNDSVVEDLLQEGYIVVLGALKSFDNNKEAHFLAYVKSKIKYFYMNHYRESIKISASLTDLKNANQNQLIDFEESLEQTIIKEEENSLLKLCIDKLSEKEQRLVFSYFYAERSISEIAKDLDISNRAVLNRKSRIIKKLKKCIYRRWDYGRNY